MKHMLRGTCFSDKNIFLKTMMLLTMLTSVICRPCEIYSHFNTDIGNTELPKTIFLDMQTLFHDRLFRLPCLYFHRPPPPPPVTPKLPKLPVQSGVTDCYYLNQVAHSDVHVSRNSSAFHIYTRARTEKVAQKIRKQIDKFWSFNKIEHLFYSADVNIGRITAVNTPVVRTSRSGHRPII